MELHDYYNLIKRYFDGQITAYELKHEYLSSIKKNERQLRGEPMDSLLSAIFIDLERYDPFDLPDKELFQRLNEPELRVLLYDHYLQLNSLL